MDDDRQPPGPAAQRFSWRRHRAAAVSLGVLLLILVALGLCEWRGWPFLRGPLQRTLSQHLDRDVQVGNAFKLRLLGPLRVRSDLLKVGPPRWAPQSPQDRFFEAHDVFLELPWSTVWNVVVSHKPVPLRISALDVGSFDAALWRQKDGRANWQFDLPKTHKQQSTTFPEFGRLLVRNGTLTLDDAPSTLKLHVLAQTDEGLSAGRDAGLGIKGDGHYREGDFNFTVRSNGVLPLIAPEGSSVSVPITLQGHTPQGRVKFDGQARDIIHLQALQGSFDISGTSLAKVGAPFGITLPTTAPFEADGKLGKDGNVWKADIARFEVGSSRLAGNFSFDRRQQVPLLSGELRGQRLDLRDLGPAVGAAAPGAPPPHAPGKVLPDRPFDIPSLKAMNADVRVNLQLLDLHTALLEPLSPLQGRILLHEGVLKIDSLDARTSGGEIKGTIGLDGRQVRSPRWNGDLRVSGVQLEQWLHLRDTHAKPETTVAQGKAPAKNYVTGRLGGHFQFTGTGRSVADMAGSMDGTLAAWVNDGRISHLALEAAGIDVAQALGVLVKGDDSLPMQCAVTQFSARDGVLHSDVALVDTSDTTMMVHGDVSLAKEQLALVAQAYPKDFSPAALRSPIHIEGTFKQPHVRLEAKPIAIKAAAAAVLGAVATPLAALIPLVDPGKKAPVGCQQALENLKRVHGVEQPKVQASGTSQAFAQRKEAPVENGPGARAAAAAASGARHAEGTGAPRH